MLTVLDQHKAAITATTSIKFKVEGSDAVPTAVGVGTNGEAKIPENTFTKAGIYNVILSEGDKNLGTVKVEVVDASNSVATEYKITDDAEEVLDLTVGENKNDEKSYKLVGIADGVDLDSLTKTVDALKEANQGEGKLVVESSNKDVVTVNETDGATINDTTGAFGVTAVKAGTAKVTVSFVAGAVKKELKSVDVTVKNDTPQYTQDNVSLLKGENATEAPKALEVEDTLTKEKIEAGLAYKDEKLATGSVASFKLVNQAIDKNGNVEGTVLVKTTAAYGGEELEFPAVIKAKASTKIPGQVNTFTENGGNGLAGIGSTNSAAIKLETAKATFDLSKVTDTTAGKTLVDIAKAQNSNGHGGNYRILADVKLTGETNEVLSKLFAGTDAKTFYQGSTLVSDPALGANTALFYVTLANVKAGVEIENVTAEDITAASASTTTYTAVWTDSATGAVTVETYTVVVNPTPAS